MKKRFLISFVLILCFILIIPANTYAISLEQQQKCARTLERLQVMLGDGKGNLMLDRPITRTELFTLIIRMMGYDRNANVSNITLDFKDANEIPAWAVDYIKIALKYDLVKGYNDNTLRPNANVTNAEAQTIILRALGYGKDIEGDWPQAVLAKSEALKLNKGVDLSPNKKLTRGETAVIIYNSLSINFK